MRETGNFLNEKKIDLQDLPAVDGQDSLKEKRNEKTSNFYSIYDG